MENGKTYVVAHTCNTSGQVPGDGIQTDVHCWCILARRQRHVKCSNASMASAFTGKEKLKAHLNMLEEAAKRDHRKLGREMNLFHMQEEAPGQIFWHPQRLDNLHFTSRLYAPQAARRRISRD